MGRVRLSLLIGLLLAASGDSSVGSDSLTCLPAWNTVDSTAGVRLTPDALALDPLDRLWILDRARGRVMRFQVGEGSVGSFPVTTEGGDLPLASDLGASGSFLYVLEATTPRVILLDLDGHYREHVDLADAALNGWRSGFLASRILVDRSGDLWLVESASGGLLRLDRRGRFLDAPLELLPGQQRPARIADVALGPGDELVILDPSRRRIMVLGPDGVLQAEHALADAPREPAALAVDRRGNLYLIEATGRVRIISSGGKLLWDGVAPGDPATRPQRACVIGDSILCRTDTVLGTIRRWRIGRTETGDGSE